MRAILLALVLSACASPGARQVFDVRLYPVERIDLSLCPQNQCTRWGTSPLGRTSAP